jgi:hypothetical protein
MISPIPAVERRQHPARPAGNPGLRPSRVD